MQWRTSGETVSLPLDFSIEDQFVIPDDGSVHVTVRDDNGAIIAGYDNVEVNDGTAMSLSDTTPPILKLPAAVNVVDSANTFEARFVIVDYTVADTPVRFTLSYRLAAFLPITVSKDDVRARWGVTKQELPDADIDLTEAYFALSHTVGADLRTALSKGSIASIAANNAIGLRAALLVAPSLQGRMLKSEKQSNAGVERQAVDLERLRGELEAELANQLGIMKADLGSTVTSTLAPMFTKVTPTDPITNA